MWCQKVGEVDVDMDMYMDMDMDMDMGERAVAVVWSDLMVIDGVGWYWMVLDVIRWYQMILDGEGKDLWNGGGSYRGVKEEEKL